MMSLVPSNSLRTAAIRAMLIGPAATAIGINGIAHIVHSAWVLPLGSLVGGLLTTLVLLWGPWGARLRPVLRVAAQRTSRSASVTTFVVGTLLFGIICFLQGTQYKHASCVQQANCTAYDIFSLTVFALFLTFWAFLCAMLATQVWYRLRPPIMRREEQE